MPNNSHIYVNKHKTTAIFYKTLSFNGLHPEEKMLITE